MKNILYKTLVFVCVWALLPASLFSMQPRVLMHYKGHTFGGAANDVLIRHKQFLQHGLTSVLLVHKGTEIIKKLEENGLPYELIGGTGANKRTGIFIAMLYLCKKHKINTIFCASNDFDQLHAAKQVKDLLGVSLIYVEHNQIDALMHGGTKRYKNTKYIIPKSLHDVLEHTEKFDGFIGVNERITAAVAKFNSLNPNEKNRIRNFATIKPFLNEGKFLSFHTKESRQQYFKRTHNIHLTNDTPIVTMLAGFYNQKRHDVLIAAFDLIRNSTNAHLVFAGDGVNEARIIRRLVSSLKLDDRVHFLGFVDDTAAVLYHSDIHVLSSRTETIGLATAEAALMKKPVIGTAGTGADFIIVDGQTGYLFKNGDAIDLADKMLAILNTPDFGKTMGEAGYNLIQELFGAGVIYNQTAVFLAKILNGKKV